MCGKTSGSSEFLRILTQEIHLEANAPMLDPIAKVVAIPRAMAYSESTSGFSSSATKTDLPLPDYLYL